MAAYWRKYTACIHHVQYEISTDAKFCQQTTIRNKSELIVMHHRIWDRKDNLTEKAYKSFPKFSENNLAVQIHTDLMYNYIVIKSANQLWVQWYEMVMVLV